MNDDIVRSSDIRSRNDEEVENDGVEAVVMSSPTVTTNTAITTTTTSIRQKLSAGGNVSSERDGDARCGTTTCNTSGNESGGKTSSDNTSATEPPIVTSTNTTTATTSSDDKATASSDGDHSNSNNNTVVFALGTEQHHTRHHHHHSYHHHHHHHHHPVGNSSAHRAGTKLNARQQQLPNSSSASVVVLEDNTDVCDHHRATVMAQLPPPDSSSSGGSSAGEGDAALENMSLLLLCEPYKEPGFHKIKTTFKRVVSKKKMKKLSSAMNSETLTESSLEEDNEEEEEQPKKPSSNAVAASKLLKKTVIPEKTNICDSGDGSSSEDNCGTEAHHGACSSGSGTEGGYAASASSNDKAPRRINNTDESGGDAGSCSPSLSPSEDTVFSPPTKRTKGGGSGDLIACGTGAANPTTTVTTRPLLMRKNEPHHSMSSDIADFSSGDTESKVAETMKALQETSSSYSTSSSESVSSNLESGSDDCLKDSSARGPAFSSRGCHDRKRRATALLPKSFALSFNNSGSNGGNSQAQQHHRKSHHRHHHHHNHHNPPAEKRAHNASDEVPTNASRTNRPPIMTVGSDIMVHILTFLEPTEILNVLTMPLSKQWLSTFSRQQEIWRVLCLLEPFKTQVEDDDSTDDSDSNSEASFMEMSSELKRRFGKFRILYTSFVRCLRYLARIKDDALNGRPPSVIDYGLAAADVNNCNSTSSISLNQNLQSFLAQARGAMLQNQNNNENAQSTSSSFSSSDEDQGRPSVDERVEPVAIPDYGIAFSPSQLQQPEKKKKLSSSMRASKKKSKKRRLALDHKQDDYDGKNRGQPNKKRKVRYVPSMITQRLLLPSSGGVVTRQELPWSCAIYAIVNWMVGFSNAEGIQTMCLKVLPSLMEDEQQRMTAQRAGLTNIVLRAMVMFPNSTELHTAAFHTIVLLARPLGGREGMLFHTSMVSSSGIFNAIQGGPCPAVNGKNGIAVMLDSMRRFQHNGDLQTMSCWSLVNIALVPAQKDVLIKLGGIEVTTNSMMAHPHNAEVQFRALFALINMVIPCANRSSNAAPGPEEQTEREVLDEMVEQIVVLVVRAMQNFCSSEAILNRACLVLHNLSLTQDYHGSLLWTPNCYQMLEWCLSNYRTDQILQQSAASTLHRLQLTLSTNEGMRLRFNSALASQQQLSLEQAHREAVLLYEQQALNADAAARQV